MPEGHIQDDHEHLIDYHHQLQVQGSEKALAQDVDTQKAETQQFPKLTRRPGPSRLWKLLGRPGLSGLQSQSGTPEPSSLWSRSGRPGPSSLSRLPASGGLNVLPKLPARQGASDFAWPVARLPGTRLPNYEGISGPGAEPVGLKWKPSEEPDSCKVYMMWIVFVFPFC